MTTPYQTATAELRSRPRRWLVTGAAGFIGSHLVETLLALDQHVVGLDDLSLGSRRNLEEVRSLVSAGQWSRLRFVEGDVRVASTCRDACSGVDFVLHQAAIGSVPRSIADPLTSHDRNVNGHLAMLLAARDAGVKRFVYASSSSVYGDHPALPKREAEIGRPLSPYALTKWIDEAYADLMQRVYGLTCIGLRYFNVFGSRQDPEGAYAAVIPRWTAAMINQWPVQINGTGETSRDFCYVDNAVQANVLAAVTGNQEAWGQLFNVAVDRRTTLGELFELLRQKLLPRHPHLADLKPRHVAFRPGDVMHSQADISKARRMLGYEPTHTIEQGLDLALPWYEANALRQRKPTAGAAAVRERTVGVVGLGYVGLPVAMAMGSRFRTIGYDINRERIRELAEGHDRTLEVDSEALKGASVRFTCDLQDLRQADFFIVAVPTPVDVAHQPDLTPLIKASEAVGKCLKQGDLVVYESTVYPGATEEDCLPVLEKFSGLRGGVDFKVGYSPERINPADKEHTFTRIRKIVSGQDQETLEMVASVYGAVIEAGVHRAQSIKVAEAAKVIENTQRDLNVALMNELALIFDQMGIDTHAVLEAAGTKWNFLKFSPGLVGGHCIGVDPYYLTHKAEKLGYIPQVILAGRRINDGMGKYIAQQTIKQMILAGHRIMGETVTLLGLTFKENCPDIRNTRVVDILRELREHGVVVQVCDPLADPDEARREYGVDLVPLSDLKPAAALVLAVAHDQFRRLGPPALRRLGDENPVLIDVKGLFPLDAPPDGFRIWRL